MYSVPLIYLKKEGGVIRRKRGSFSGWAKHASSTGFKTVRLNSFEVGSSGTFFRVPNGIAKLPYFNGNQKYSLYSAIYR